MRPLLRLSFVVLLLAACGGTSKGGGAGAPAEPILSAGTVELGGKNVAIAYGATRVSAKTGTVAMAMSDVEMNCSTFDITAPPDHGTFVSIQVPSLDKGVAAEHFVDFSVFANGDYAGVGGGSNQGTVEVLDATDTIFSVRVAYRYTIKDVEQAVNGDFTTVRCP